jgi:hypothetical protein
MRIVDKESYHILSISDKVESDNHKYLHRVQAMSAVDETTIIIFGTNDIATALSK